MSTDIGGSGQRIALLLAFLCLSLPVQGQQPPDLCREDRRADLGRMAASDRLGVLELCLSAYPEDADLWVLKASSLLQVSRFQDALETAEAVIDSHPGYLDARVLALRALVGLQRLPEAHKAAEQLPSEWLQDPENSVLWGDLSFWAGDYLEASYRYDRHLQRFGDDPGVLRKLGLCRLELGDSKEALSALDRSCAADGRGDSCRMAGELRARNSRWLLGVSGGLLHIEEGATGWNAGVLVGRNLGSAWRLSAAGDFRTRDYGDGSMNDVYLEGQADFRWGGRWSLSGTLGGTHRASFSPELSAALEAGVRLDFGLELFLKYWRIQFPSGGAHVLAPRLFYYLGPLLWDLRYYLSFKDEGGLGHAVLGRVTWYVSRLSPFLGAGRGDTNDYMELRHTGTELFWLIWAGIGVDVGSTSRVIADYVYRYEEASQIPMTLHQFTLRYEIKF
jgi:hypothetical protein